MKYASFCFLLLIFSRPILAAPEPASAEAYPLLAEAKRAVNENKISDLAALAEQQLHDALLNLNQLDLDRITRLATIRRYSTYFAKLNTADDRYAKPLLWLLDQPKLLTTLMLAVSERDEAANVMDVLSALRAADPARLEQFSDLATAMCVVWDEPANGTDPDQQRADIDRPLRLFRYFANARGRPGSFDVTQMPWQLATFVADNTVSQDEMAWAAQRYAGRGAIGSAYFDVPYDYVAYYGTSDKRLAAQSYTLQNIVRLGGVCSDQAYFATAVARSLGIPAAVCHGQAAMAEAHAWVGYLEVRGKQVRWNFEQGRYADLKYARGIVRDPQTRNDLSDSEVSLLAELARTSTANRLASIALCRSHDLIADEQQAALLMRAINLSPGNRDAWMALAQLGANRQLSASQMTEARDVVVRFAAKDFPDFAYEILFELHAGLATAQRSKALESARTLFPTRPDLLAQSRIDQANLLRLEKRYSEALSAYGAVLSSNKHSGVIVLSVLDQVESMLRETRDLPRLAGIYRQCWLSMPQPAPSGYVRISPFHKIGQRYIAILHELGQEQEAKSAQSRLDSIDTTTRRGGY